MNDEQHDKRRDKCCVRDCSITTQQCTFLSQVSSDKSLPMLTAFRHDLTIFGKNKQPGQKLTVYFNWNMLVY